MFYDRPSWDSRRLFMIVVTVIMTDSEESGLSIIRELWRIGRGYNVVVEVVQQDEASTCTRGSLNHHKTTVLKSRM